MTHRTHPYLNGQLILDVLPVVGISLDSHQIAESIGYPVAAVREALSEMASRTTPTVRFANGGWLRVRTPEPFVFYPAPDYNTFRPATSWFWQAGNVWCAVDEDPESWFDDMNLSDPFQREVTLTFLIRDIADVPTTGTLRFRDKDGVEHVTDAA